MITLLRSQVLSTVIESIVTGQLKVSVDMNTNSPIIGILPIDVSNIRLQQDGLLIAKLLPVLRVDKSFP